MDLSQVSVAKYYKQGILKNNIKIYVGSATTASGQAIFYLTDDGTAGGDALFTTVYTEGMATFFNNSTVSMACSIASLSGDNKTLTLNVNQLGTVILGIIQFVTVSNGLTVSIIVHGE